MSHYTETLNRLEKHESGGGKEKVNSQNNKINSSLEVNGGKIHNKFRRGKITVKEVAKWDSSG